MKKIINLLQTKQTTLIPLVDQGVVSGGNFLLGVLLARQLGLAKYGEFALLWLVVLFCSSIHHSWIVTPMYTFASRNTEETKKRYFSGLFWHQLLFSLIASLCAALFMRFTNWEVVQTGGRLSLLVFSYLMYDFSRRLSYTEEKPKKALVIDLVAYGIQAVGFVIISMLWQLDITICFELMTISYIVAFFIGIRFRIPAWNTIGVISVAVQHWKFSKWLIGTSLLQWFSGNFFILAAASLLSPLAIGAIRIIQNVMGVLHVLFLAIENQVPIRASNLLQAKGWESVAAYLKNITWKGGLLTLVVGGLLAFFGEEIIGLLYGEEQAAYAYLLYGFVLLYMLVFSGTILRFAIRTIEQTQGIFYAYILSTLFSVCTAKPIIQYVGIQGIVIGLIATQVIMQAYFIYLLKIKTTKLCVSSI